MSTLFISDLHLDESRPEATRAFFAFLRGSARSAEALYILGDLFEAWIGDDDDSALVQQVATELRRLQDHGVSVLFQHGNRDFLLGKDYAERCGMRLLPESWLIELDGTATLLLHGDSLCTRDVGYQAFRRQSRDPAWQAAMLSQPLAARRQLAARARGESAAHQANQMASVGDVDAGEVLAVMREHGVSRLIHGHTHRRAIHHLDLDGKAAERIVLGDWYEQGSALVVQAGRLRSLAVPFAGDI